MYNYLLAGQSNAYKQGRIISQENQSQTKLFAALMVRFAKLCFTLFNKHDISNPVIQNINHKNVKVKNIIHTCQSPADIIWLFGNITVIFVAKQLKIY